MKAGKFLPILIVVCTTPAHSAQFDTSGPWQASVDVTLTYAATWRLDDPDAALIADPNLDDANRNFKSGLVSNGIRGIVDFETRYTLPSKTEIGFFARAAGWYDAEVDGKLNDHDSPVTSNSGPLYGSMSQHNQFHPDTEDRVGSDAELLDAFLFADISPSSDHPSSLRVGRQVISWGESAFIQNGLSSVINPADTSKASLPGTEVKEILRPMAAVSGSFSLSGNLTVQAYAQFEWEETIAPPYGSYYSPVPDPLSGEGGETFLLPVGALVPQLPFPQDPSFFALPFIAVDRAPDREASDDGQWGVALNWYVPSFNDTEFGFYAGNYHRKRPTIVFRNTLGTPNNDWLGQCMAGAGPAAGSCVPLSLVAIGFDAASYQLDYADDIEYYGLSWNTVINWTDTAFSGEVIYHNDVPIQTISLLDGLIGTVLPGLPPPIGVMPGASFETPLFSRHEMIVTQMTFNQNFKLRGFADDMTLIAELGWIHMPDLEDSQIWSGNAPADRDSYAYRLAFSSTWYDGLGKIIPPLTGTNLIWTVNFAHDFNGTSPVVGTGFVDGAKAFSTALEADWLSTWSVVLSYTDFFGDGKDTLGQDLGDNVLGDRDNISLSVKYRF
jgi:hypothetical protein